MLGVEITFLYHLLYKKLIDRLTDLNSGRLDKSVSGFENIINSL